MTAREEVIVVTFKSLSPENQPPENQLPKNKPLVNRSLSNTASIHLLNNDEQQALLAELPDWHIAGDDDDKQIRRTFQFKNYAEALKFTADLGALAENCGCYPTIITVYQKVTVMWHTTGSKNLQINDFILAAKTSALIGGS